MNDGAIIQVANDNYGFSALYSIYIDA